MEKFDFTKLKAAQDMICLIMQDENLSKEEALKFSINKEIAKRIIQTGWGPIALPIWGHGNPERKWKSLENAVIEVDLDDSQKRLIKFVEETQEVETEIALAYFLLFTMEKLGYHI